MSSRLFCFRYSSENSELEASLRKNWASTKSRLYRGWTTCITDLSLGEGSDTLEHTLISRGAQPDDALFFLGSGVRALTPGVFPLVQAVCRAGPAALGILPDYFFGKELEFEDWRGKFESADYEMLQHADLARGNPAGILEPPVAAENFICSVGLWRQIREGVDNLVPLRFLMFSEGAVGMRNETRDSEPLMVLDRSDIGGSLLLGEPEVHSQQILCGRF